MRTLQDLVRKNIWALKPYACARDEFKGEASVFLDANENPFGYPYNRYPDPRQTILKSKISRIKGVPAEQILLGNGSDEPIDLTIRIFCEPGIDNMVAIEPTYGMYRVAADINNVEYRPVNLDSKFDIDTDAIKAAVDSNTKVIWLCSPNNPTGNDLSRDRILDILNWFDGIVVLDEAYIDFAGRESWLKELDKFPKLIILQTFSKAWGMASVRCGMAFASKEIISLYNNVKYPYNINLLTQTFVSERLKCIDEKEEWVASILAERSRMATELGKLSTVYEIYPSDANFLLVRVKDANATYRSLIERGVVVRNRNSVTLCGNCLRITIGTKEENETLIKELMVNKE
ncbi:MAG: histidinol-phosphate transaminase [Paludibacteraceae bacterium]|nr:histidinol-phosphate transaminase [Paludibacteraceae bacterium]